MSVVRNEYRCSNCSWAWSEEAAGERNSTCPNCEQAECRPVRSFEVHGPTMTRRNAGRYASVIEGGRIIVTRTDGKPCTPADLYRIRQTELHPQLLDLLARLLSGDPAARQDAQQLVAAITPDAA